MDREPVRAAVVDTELGVLGGRIRGLAEGAENMGRPSAEIRGGGGGSP